MISEGKFGVHEGVCLITIAISSKLFFTSPGQLTRFVGPAAWYTTLISVLTAILMFAIIFRLIKRFPGKSIVEIFYGCLGKKVGMIFALIYMTALLINGAIVSREFVDVMKVFIFPDTPTSYLIGALIISAIIAANLGLETIARIAKLSAYVLLSGYVLVLLLAIRDFNFSNMFPILGYGIEDVLIHGIRRSSVYEEVALLIVFATCFQGTKYIKKIGYTSLVISGMIISSGLLCFSLVFPYEVTQEITAPMYVVTRTLKYGSFFQRLDTLFVFIWIFTTIITVSLLLYASVSIYSKTFYIQDYKPILIPTGIILFTISLIPDNFEDVVLTYVQNWREYSTIAFYILPIITLVISLIRMKKGEPDDA